MNKPPKSQWIAEQYQQSARQGGAKIQDFPLIQGFPLNGLLCSVCGMAQRVTPSGPTCASGHGGAPGIEPSPEASRRPGDARLIFLDMETSGLDPRTDFIFEIGVTVVSVDLEYQMPRTLEPGIFFLRIPQYEVPIQQILEDSDPRVRKIHQESGLVAESQLQRREMKRLPEIEDELIDWISKGHGFVPRTGVLAGSSIHFDRSFITHQMPRLDAFLHYRMLDVSAIREAYLRWVDADWSRVWKSMQGHATHRTMDDIRASVAELKFFRERLFR